MAIEMPGMNGEEVQEGERKKPITDDMVSKSFRSYYAGYLESKDEAELNSFGNFVPRIQATPILVERFQGIFIKTIAAGYSFSAAVSADGRLFTWGFNGKNIPFLALHFLLTILLTVMMSGMEE
jgi:hypothetical protein